MQRSETMGSKGFFSQFSFANHFQKGERDSGRYLEVQCDKSVRQIMGGSRQQEIALEALSFGMRFTSASSRSNLEHSSIASPVAKSLGGF